VAPRRRPRCRARGPVGTRQGRAPGLGALVRMRPWCSSLSSPTPARMARDRHPSAISVAPSSERTVPRRPSGAHGARATPRLRAIETGNEDSTGTAKSTRAGCSSRTAVSSSACPPPTSTSRRIEGTAIRGAAPRGGPRRILRPDRVVPGGFSDQWWVRGCSRWSRRRFSLSSYDERVDP
jgi:hypothetical protein